MKYVTILLQLIFLLIVRPALAGEVQIQGTIGNFDGETIVCATISNNLLIKPSGVVIPVKDGRFNHRFEFSGVTFLKVSDGVNYFGGFVEPGDSVVIQYDFLNFNNSISYLGLGKEKFEIANAIRQLKDHTKENLANAKTKSFPVNYLFRAIDSLKISINRQLSFSVTSMSRESYVQLRGYLAANVLDTKYNSLISTFGDSYNAILKKYRHKLDTSDVDQIRKLIKFEEEYYGSRFYVNSVRDIGTIYLEENVQPDMNNFAERKYQILADMLPGRLRSPVIFSILVADIAKRENDINDAIFWEGSDLLADHELKEGIANLLRRAHPLHVGDKAPDFSLQSLSGEKVNLASFAGKTVYVDFWFAACGPCHALFKAIEPVKNYFKGDARVVFLTVSVDDENTWRKAVTKFRVKGEHVFTENKFRDHSVIRSYNVGAYPTTFIINPEGKLSAIQASTNPDILRRQIKLSLSAVER